jgi:hypothetical protein
MCESAFIQQVLLRVQRSAPGKNKQADEQAPQQVSPDVPESMRGLFEPKQQQRDAIEKLRRNNGKLVLAHRMGMGKTACAVYGMEDMRERGQAQRALVIVPSGLRENFATEGIRKFTKGRVVQIVASSGEKGREGYVRPKDVSNMADYTIVSYDLFRRDPEGLMRASGADTIICDEFHKARNEGTTVFSAIATARPMAKNFMGLTASLVNNDPAEIASLLTLSEGRRMITPAQFRQTHMQTVGYELGYGGSKRPVKKLKNKELFQKNVLPRVDYADTDLLNTPGGDVLQPRKDVKYVDVEMSPEQYAAYNIALKKVGNAQAMMNSRHYQLDVKQADLFFTQVINARQISNSLQAAKPSMDVTAAAEATPKVARVINDTVEHLTNVPDAQVVLYSNLVRGGADVLSAGLSARGIKHELFIGNGTELGGTVVTDQTRSAGVKRFKEGASKVIIVTGAGSEGLSLNNATAFFALDGHFNPERVLQAEARAVRLNGQMHRPPEQRVVDVRRYRSIAPAPTGFQFFRKAQPKATTIDEWTYNTAQRKALANYDVIQALQTKRPVKYISKTPKTDGQGYNYKYPKENPVFGGLFSRKFAPPRQAGPPTAPQAAPPAKSPP